MKKRKTEAHGEIETEHLGYLDSDTRYVGLLRAEVVVVYYDF
jgi:hypothetical protein